MGRGPIIKRHWFPRDGELGYEKSIFHGPHMREKHGLQSLGVSPPLLSSCVTLDRLSSGSEPLGRKEREGEREVGRK